MTKISPGSYWRARDCIEETLIRAEQEHPRIGTSRLAGRIIQALCIRGFLTSTASVIAIRPRMSKWKHFLHFIGWY